MTIENQRVGPFDLAGRLWAGESLARAWLNRRLSLVRLEGLTLDLGGGGSNAPHLCARAPDVRIITLDLRTATRPSCAADFEQALPLRPLSARTVLALNLLEHLARPERLLKETARVLAQGGALHVFVPALYPRHTLRKGPLLVEDHHRFGPATLERMAREAGYDGEIEIVPCETGPFGAAASVAATGLPFAFLRAAVITCGLLADGLRTSLARKDRGEGASTEWHLAYWMTARKTCSGR